MCLGGQVERGHGTAEFGRAYVTPTDLTHPILAGWFRPRTARGARAGLDEPRRPCLEIAPGFEVYGTSPNAPFAITADPARHFYAVQFHPEVHHTPKGAQLYENFVRLAGFKGDWTMGAYREEAIAQDPRAGGRREGDLRPVGRRRHSRSPRC